MANKLLQLPGNRLFNNSNIASPGGTATLYLSKTSTLANFLDAEGVPLGPTITANGLGQLPDAYGDETVAYRVILRDSHAVELDGGDIDPFYFGRDNSLIVTASGASVNSRALLSQIATPAANQSAILTESGREGTFVFDTSDLSASVTADPNQGIYVAPSSDTTGASGAWVRSDLTILRPEWFGAPADGVSDDLAAVNAMLAWIAFENRNAATFYRGSRECLFASTAYYFSDTIDLKSTVRFRGFGTGSAGGLSTKLKWAADKAGFRVQRYNTTGENGAGTAGTGGDGSIIEGFYLEGSGTTANLLHAGIWMRARAFVRDCRIAGFAGPGTLVYASVGGSGAAYGNANGWEISNVRIENCKYNGHYCTGSDANAGKATLLDITNCAQYGIFDTCFLANTYEACQIASCGLGGMGGLSQTSVVSDGTYRYQLVHGQDANAATTAPTAGGTNSVWALQGTGGTNGTLIPLYSTYVASGGSFVSGGSYYLSNANALHVLLGCYHESGQADPWVDSPALAIGGTLGSSTNRGTGTLASGASGGLTAKSMMGITDSVSGVTRAYELGEVNNAYTAVRIAHTTYAPNSFRLAFGVNGGANYPQDLWTHYNNVPIEKLTGPSTNEQYGTGANQPYFRHAIKFALGPYNNGGARIMTYGAAAPASGTHAKGEIVFNNAATAGGIFAWICTTTGTPGTWTPLYSMTAAKGTAYAAWTGTANRATKDTATATVTDVAQTLKALIDDLQARGVI